MDCLIIFRSSCGDIISCNARYSSRAMQLRLPDPVLLQLLSPLPPPRCSIFPPAPPPPFASCCSVPRFALPGLFLALASSDARPTLPVYAPAAPTATRKEPYPNNRQQLLATDGRCLAPACSTFPVFVVALRTSTSYRLPGRHCLCAKAPALCHQGPGAAPTLR